ncbi:MAG TPA: nucleotidyltransferase domain-containing protein [Longimicrobium sp.]|nr:nucleotidyltransferase domain-containing protein [Longimicrobium sp.]
MGAEIERAKGFARDLANGYGADLVSVVLYGSAARGHYREGVSDLNVLVLLRDTAPATLRRGSKLARAWVDERNPPPLMLSDEEWRRSADVFPIEMSDMRDAHLVLHGADPFTGFEIDPADLRLQCEHELKGKQIQLRERYLLSAGEPEELRPLLAKSFSTFLVLFRTVLRLEGGEAPRDPAEVVRRIAARVGVDPAALLAVHAARGGAAIDTSADGPVVTGYLEAIEAVVRHVDRLSHGG